jgi:uncharacterized protein YndB with AHSA1/START domain
MPPVLYINVEATIRRRPEVVWDVLTDIAALPVWVEGLVEATTSSDALAVGVELRISRRSGPRAAVARAVAEVTVCRPPALLVLETRAPGLLFLDRVELAPTSEGTDLRFATEIAYESKLAEAFARPSGLLLGSVHDHPLDAIYERSVEALVKRVETISAAPYR